MANICETRKEHCFFLNKIDELKRHDDLLKLDLSRKK